MFRSIKALSEAAQACVDLLSGIRADLASAEPAQDPELEQAVQRLEVSRAKWEAEIEALILKAKGQYDSARNAEERTKTMKKSYNAEADEGDAQSMEDVANAYRELGYNLSGGDGEGGEPNGVQPVPEGLAPHTKMAPVMAKWMR